LVDGQDADPTARESRRPDKFLGTELENILKSTGIKTVVVTGMAAEGAVMYTASHAAFIGLKVVVPVDTAPSNTDFAQLYVAWNLANAPRVAAATTLTTTAQLTY
jgi:nicotinamidase-related amidase